MPTIRLAAALTLVTGLVVAGCVHDNGPTPDPPRPAAGTGVPEGVTNAQNAADLRIADELATARCDRARVCNDIGNGQKYLSRDLCMTKVRGDIANDLTGYTCPRGVDPRAVDRCTTAIQHGDCGKETALSTMPDCKAENLCLR